MPHIRLLSSKLPTSLRHVALPLPRLFPSIIVIGPLAYPIVPFRLPRHMLSAPAFPRTLYPTRPSQYPRLPRFHRSYPPPSLFVLRLENPLWHSASFPGTCLLLRVSRSIAHLLPSVNPKLVTNPLFCLDLWESLLSRLPYIVSSSSHVSCSRPLSPTLPFYYPILTDIHCTLFLFAGASANIRSLGRCYPPYWQTDPPTSTPRKTKSLLSGFSSHPFSLLSVFDNAHQTDRTKKV